MSPADLQTVLSGATAAVAGGVDADDALGPVLARSRRLRRRRRVTSTIAAVALVAGGGAAVVVAAGGPPTERTTTIATDPAGPTTPAPAPRSHRTWISTEAHDFADVGLTAAASSTEMGPLVPGVVSIDVELRATRPVVIDSVSVTGPPGAGASMCGGDGRGEDEAVCDEPDRSVDGDGWTLAAGGVAAAPVFVDTARLGPGEWDLVSVVVTDGGTVTVPVHVEIVASTEEPPTGDHDVFADGEGPGSVRLRPIDWRVSVEGGRANAFSGAPYVVVDASGATDSTGNAGFYGEAILTLEPGTYTVRIDALVDGTPCGFSITVEAVASEVLDVEPTCR